MERNNIEKATKLNEYSKMLELFIDDKIVSLPYSDGYKHTEILRAIGIDKMKEIAKERLNEIFQQINEL